MRCIERIVHFSLIQDSILFNHLQPHIRGLYLEFWNYLERGVLVRCPYVVTVIDVVSNPL